MALDRFTKASFDSKDAAGKAELASELAAALTAFVAQGRSPRELVEALRSLGHDLWSFDEDGEGMEVWMPNWHTPTGPGITITFTLDGVSVEW